MAMAPAEQTDSHLQNVLQLLNAAIVAGQKLSSSIGSVNIALRRIQSEQEEIETVARSNANLDPETAAEIRELKRRFRSSISCAKVFITGCVSAAEYGSDKEIEKEIKEELEQGKLDTLKSFLTHFVKCLKQSKKQLENFNSSQAEANEIAKEMMKRYKDKLNKTTSDTNAAMVQHETALLSSNVATETKLVSGTALDGGLTTHLWPQQPLLMAMASCAVACGSFVLENVAEARGLAAKNDLTRSMIDKMKFENALESIYKLQQSMDVVMKITNDIATHVDNAFREASKVEGLGMHNESGNTAVKQDILLSLESLLTSLRHLLQVFEEHRQDIITDQDEIHFPPKLD